MRAGSLTSAAKASTRRRDSSPSASHWPKIAWKEPPGQLGSSAAFLAAMTHLTRLCSLRVVTAPALYGITTKDLQHCCRGTKLPTPRRSPHAMSGQDSSASMEFHTLGMR